MEFTVEDGYAITIDAVQIYNDDCTGMGVGGIDITISGGQEPYVIEWENGSTDEDLVGAAAGVYSVSVRDSNGCEGMQVFAIPQDSDIEIDFTIQDTRCFDMEDGAIYLDNINGMPPFDIQWNTGDTTRSIQNLAAGIYMLTIVDGNGCTLFESFSVASPPALDFQLIAEQPTCEEAGFIWVETIDFTGLTFEWSTGANMESITDLSIGSYSVTVIDENDCEYVDEVSLIQPDCPIIINIEDANIKCDEMVISMSIEIIGGSMPYDVIATNNETGVETEFVLIDPPFILEDLGTGMYTIEVESDEGDIGIATFNITESEPPTVVLSSLFDYNGFDIDCYGENSGTILSEIEAGTAPYKFEWNTGDTDIQLTQIGAGTYYVTVTDENSCTASSMIELIQPPVLDADFSLLHPDCIDPLSGRIDVEGLGGVMPYTLNFDGKELEDDLTIESLGEGDYDIILSDANNCIFQKEIELIAPKDFSVDLGDDIVVEIGNTAIITVLIESTNVEIDTIIWIGGFDDLCVNCKEQVFNPTSSGVVEILVLDEDGCEASDEVFITVEENASKVYFPNIFSPNGDGLNEYFMPFTSSGAGININRMAIFDRWGKRIFIQEDFISSDISAAWDGTSNNRNIESGVYVYIVEYEDVSGKLTVQSGDVTLVF